MSITKECQGTPKPQMNEMSAMAVLLDRDGIINELVYYPEHGIVDSPFVPEQMKLASSAIKAVHRFHELGFKVLVISNQPGMAKGHFDQETFNSISAKMQELLARAGARIDAEYYCFHHPNAVREEYRRVCDCRKPKPGLILRAARDHHLCLSKSFLIGDGIVDVKAGNEAGCKTILIAPVNQLLLRLLAEENAQPDHIVQTLGDAIKIVEAYSISN